jgi:hypothetical protein
VVSQYIPVSQFDPSTPGNRLQPVAGGKENGAGADIDFAEGVPIPQMSGRLLF